MPSPELGTEDVLSAVKPVGGTEKLWSHASWLRISVLTAGVAGVMLRLLIRYISLCE